MASKTRLPAFCCSRDAATPGRSQATYSISEMVIYCFQTLESKRSKLSEHYEKIAQDKRHRDVELLSVQKIQERMFGTLPAIDLIAGLGWQLFRWKEFKQVG